MTLRYNPCGSEKNHSAFFCPTDLFCDYNILTSVSVYSNLIFSVRTVITKLFTSAK